MVEDSGYLSKHAFTSELIPDAPQWDLSTVVVIPAYNEPGLLQTLTDLWTCDACEGSVEVIVIINLSENSDAEVTELNEKIYKEAYAWAQLHIDPRKRFHIQYQPDLPEKKAGVGLARKIGMDEAVRRFLKSGTSDGVILCLDADCRVEAEYLATTEAFFREHPQVEGCSIAFEHPLQGLDENHLKAMVDYELHLRYFIGMQCWAGYPFAYQTVGSSMAVRAGVYCKVGGMNTRQAGEDFYFLHKVIERGTFAELNTTIVRPSPRASDRVPFGTGRSILDQLESGENLTTYHPRAFQDLRRLISILPLFYDSNARNLTFLMEQNISAQMRTFLLENAILEKIEEIRRHTASQDAFLKRFFRWFNAFLLMKYCHFARDMFYPNLMVHQAVMHYCKLTHPELEIPDREVDLLKMVRMIDRLST